MRKTWKQWQIFKIKKQCDFTECGNWRGITLTFVVSNVFCKVLIDIMRDGVNSNLRYEKAGFRYGRGKTTESVCSKDRTVLRISSRYKDRILSDDQELKEVDKYNYLSAIYIDI